MDKNRDFSTDRLIPFSPEVIYEAFASPTLLRSWWGPAGFTNSFETFEFKVGGHWKFEMHGPDGKSYPNRCIFTELVPASRVVIRHDCPPYFTLSVSLVKCTSGTHLYWEQMFDDLETAQAVRNIVVPSNEQNLDRLIGAFKRSVDAA